MSDTAKTKVKKKYPFAWAKEGLMSGKWYVYRSRRGNRDVLGVGENPQQAWKDAASRI